MNQAAERRTAQKQQAESESLPGGHQAGSQNAAAVFGLRVHTFNKIEVIVQDICP